MKMSVNYEWLCSLVPSLKIKTPKEIGDAFTALGAETEEIKYLNYGENVTIAKIYSIEPLKKGHLIFLERQSKFYKVVSNSQTISVNDYVLFSMNGSEVFEKETIRAKEIEGIKTDGILLALEHLGIQSKSIDIINLGNNLHQAKKASKILLARDALYTLDIPGNRPDWLSIRGLAKALSIYFNFLLSKELDNYKTSFTCPIRINMETTLCKYYNICKIENITLSSSSIVTQKRLSILGMKSINYLVDLSNMIMLETGQPNHVFDADKIKGSITIRQAKNNERMTLLDNSEILLESDDLIICDEEKIIALAGIIGSNNSAVDEKTTNIYLESANFDSITIRKSSKRLGIKTESSLRFEKNISEILVPKAQKYFCSLIMKNQKHASISTNNEIHKMLRKRNSIIVSPNTIREYLGIETLSNKFIASIIKKIGCSIKEKNKKNWIIDPCEDRLDISIKEDIIEEIGRFYGYNNIPSKTYRPTNIKLNPDKSFEEKIRPLLRGMGLSEAITMIFRSSSQEKLYHLDNSNSVSILNPLNTEWTKLRSHLFDGLLESLKINISKAFTKNIALSEIGSVFYEENHNYYEKKQLAFMISNEEKPYERGLNTLFHILNYSKLDNISAKKINTSDYPFLHPLNSFEIILNNSDILGFFGEIHPELFAKLDISDKNNFSAPVIMELSFDLLKNSSSKITLFEPLNEFPPILRDITLSIREKILGITLISEIKQMNPLIKNIEFLSLFKNEELEKEKKHNISLRLRFESSERMNTKEIDSFISYLLNYYQ